MQKSSQTCCTLVRLTPHYSHRTKVQFQISPQGGAFTPHWISQNACVRRFGRPVAAYVCQYYCFVCRIFVFVCFGLFFFYSWKPVCNRSTAFWLLWNKWNGAQAFKGIFLHFGKSVISPPPKMLKSFFQALKYHFRKLSAWREAVSHPCLRCWVRWRATACM